MALFLHCLCLQVWLTTTRGREQPAIVSAKRQDSYGFRLISKAEGLSCFSGLVFLLGGLGKPKEDVLLSCLRDRVPSLDGTTLNQSRWVSLASKAYKSE